MVCRIGNYAAQHTNKYEDERSKSIKISHFMFLHVFGKYYVSGRMARTIKLLLLEAFIRFCQRKGVSGSCTTCYFGCRPAAGIMKPGYGIKASKPVKEQRSRCVMAQSRCMYMALQ
jgi:hypothetical protein